MVENVVIGANGLVGSALMKYLADSIGTLHTCNDRVIEGRQYQYLDITNKAKVNDFFHVNRPKRVFIAAANAHVDGCENTDTDKVNIIGVGNIISECKLYNAQAVFFSSSYVFDGESQTPYRPKDETFPVNRYGRQKEITEKTIMTGDNHQWVIIRTVGVFGDDPKNFVAQVAKAVKDGRKIYVPTDQTMNPIHAMDLAKVSIHISSRYSCDIFHVSGDRCISKYDFAIQAAYKAGHKRPHDLIVGMKSDDMKQMAIRPKNGCLDCKTLERYAITIPSFDKGLRRYFGL